MFVFLKLFLRLVLSISEIIQCWRLALYWRLNSYLSSACVQCEELKSKYLNCIVNSFKGCNRYFLQRFFVCLFYKSFKRGNILFKGKKTMSLALFSCTFIAASNTVNGMFEVRWENRGYLTFLWNSIKKGENDGWLSLKTSFNFSPKDFFFFAFRYASPPRWDSTNSPQIQTLVFLLLLPGIYWY